MLTVTTVIAEPMPVAVHEVVYVEPAKMIDSPVLGAMAVLLEVWAKAVATVKRQPVMAGSFGRVTVWPSASPEI